MYAYHRGLDEWKGLLVDKSHVKNQLHQVILAHELTTFKFNSLLTIDVFFKDSIQW